MAKRSKLTLDDIKKDILKLIDNLEAQDQKIINLNWKVNLNLNNMQKQIDKMRTDYEDKLKSLKTKYKQGDNNG